MTTYNTITASPIDKTDNEVIIGNTTYTFNTFNKVKKLKFSGVIKNGIYIKEVIYNNPATIVFWNDGTKTVSKCHEDDTYSKETGLAICIIKKLLGSKEMKAIFNDWIPEQESICSTKVTLKDVIKKNKR